MFINYTFNETRSGFCEHVMLTKLYKTYTDKYNEKRKRAFLDSYRAVLGSFLSSVGVRRLSKNIIIIIIVLYMMLISLRQSEGLALSRRTPNNATKDMPESN